MTILQPLQWTRCSDLSRNWLEAYHYPLKFTILMDDKVWFAQVLVQGHNLGLWRINQNESEAKAMLEKWRSDLVRSQLTPEARVAFNL
jgi:hypothetical protein